VLAVIVFTVILFAIYKLFQKRTQKRTAALEKT
jgi:hypothetical protein